MKKAEASQQVERQAAGQQRATQDQIEGFKKSLSVCLEAKDYMVRS